MGMTMFKHPTLDEARTVERGAVLSPPTPLPKKRIGLTSETILHLASLWADVTYLEADESYDERLERLEECQKDALNRLARVVNNYKELDTEDRQALAFLLCPEGVLLSFLQL
jgi:hypothetical protein